MKIGAVEGVHNSFYNIHSVSGRLRTEEANVQNQDKLKPDETKQEITVKEEAPIERRKVTETDLEDFSTSLRKNSGYDYIGKDKDINRLDIEKAVSDMRKDQVLEQYQYFVGTVGLDGVQFGSEDGIVIRK